MEGTECSRSATTAASHRPQGDREGVQVGSRNTIPLRSADTDALRSVYTRRVRPTDFISLSHIYPLTPLLTLTDTVCRLSACTSYIVYCKAVQYDYESLSVFYSLLYLLIALYCRCSLVPWGGGR